MGKVRRSGSSCSGNLILFASLMGFAILTGLNNIRIQHQLDEKSTTWISEGSSSPFVYENDLDGDHENDNALEIESSHSDVSIPNKGDKAADDIAVNDTGKNKNEDGEEKAPSREEENIPKGPPKNGTHIDVNDSVSVELRAPSDRTNLTRSEMIRIENHEAFNSEDKIFSHFLVHIPKTGGEHVMDTLRQLTQFTRAEYKKMNLPNYQRPCNVAKRLIRFFSTRWHKHYRGVKCNMWMSERIIELEKSNSPRPYHHAYIMIRKPSEHVVSQYFHCKESKDHQYAAQFMPSFDEWLDHHVERLDNATKSSGSGSNSNSTGTSDIDEKILMWQQKRDFGCYDPIDHQSYFVRFDQTVNGEELRRRFDVMGDMAMMSKSICAISIRYSGFVPPMCDCSARVSTTTTAATSTNTTNPNANANAKADSNSIAVRNKGGRQRRKGQAIADHGVKHHGATFELTNEQEAKIAKLTQKDVLLYEYAQKLFQEEVREIEDELGITLCDDPDMKTRL